MPYVLKRRGSPFFYARWQQGGKEFVMSTKRKDKRKAEEELRRMMKAAQGDLNVDEEFKRLESALALLPPNDRDQKRHELAKRLHAGQQDKLKIADGWKTWRANPNKRRTPKDRTLDGYQAIWKRFADWAERKRSIHFHEVDERRAKAYTADLWESHVAPTTFNAHVKFLAGVFKLLEAEAGLTGNVWSKITRKDKTPDQGRRNLTDDELATVLARASGNLRVMFTLGIFTGLRLGDIVTMRWTDIDMKTGFIRLIPMKVSRLGNCKKVDLPIHPALGRVLEEHRKKTQGEFLFAQERELYAQNAGNITAPIQAFFQSCGIETTQKPENGERRRAIVRVGFHSLRHSFVSLCAKAGAPQHVVQRLVGHGSPAMTEHYTHLDDQQKQAAIEALPDIGMRDRLIET